MRIIKKQDYKEPETEKTCGKCETVFAYVESDLNHDRDGSYVICPSCNKFLAITTPADYYSK